MQVQCRWRSGRLVYSRLLRGRSERIRQLSSATDAAQKQTKHERSTHFPKLDSLNAESRQLHADAEAASERISSKDDKKDQKSDPDSSFFNMDSSLIRDLAFLSGSQLMMNMGFSQMVPVMPVFAAQIGGGLGATGVGMVMSAPSFAMFFLNMPLGRVCDTYGRKPLMYAGTAMTAAGAFLTAFTGSIWTLVPCRLLVGAGICASSTGSSAYMADLTDRAPRHRAKIMGINMGVAGSVWLVGPAVGGWLAETYGMRNSFFIVSAGAAMCSLGYTRLPETLKKGHKVSTSEDQGNLSSLSFASVRVHFDRWLDDIRPLLASGNQQALVAMSAVPALRFSCFSTVVTHFATATIGAGTQDIGFMFTALAASQGIATPLGSYLADKVTGAKFPLVLPAGLISCVSFASLSMASSLEHFLVAMAVQGVCAGFTVPSMGAFRIEVTPQEKRGQALSLERQLGSAIGLLGPISLGLLSDCAGAPAAILLTSSLMTLCHAVYLLRACPMQTAQ